METARFAIKATPLGGRTEINGKDVTPKVAAAEVRICDGQPTTLSLILSGHGTIEGEGVVQATDPYARADADVICDFLAGIDPHQLDNDVLSDADCSSDLTKGMLTMLQRYARGA